MTPRILQLPERQNELCFLCYMRWNFSLFFMKPGITNYYHKGEEVARYPQTALRPSVRGRNDYAPKKCKVRGPDMQTAVRVFHSVIGVASFLSSFALGLFQWSIMFYALQQFMYAYGHHHIQLRTSTHLPLLPFTITVSIHHRWNSRF